MGDKLKPFDPIYRSIVVNRQKKKLTLYSKPKDSYEFKKFKVYPIAVGAKGYRTTKGQYLINSRLKDPEWMKPASDWVPEEDWYVIVPGGAPENPLKARWLGVTDPAHGIGIHGTADRASIGTAASHGCIRMLVEDITELYRFVPKYTPVYIH